MLSPADLEGLNCNLVGGDIYAGSCALDQNLLWRPTGQLPGHATAVDGLWQIGASTHPGPGPRRRAPATSWPSSCCGRRCRGACFERGTDAAGKLRERLPL